MDPTKARIEEAAQKTADRWGIQILPGGGGWRYFPGVARVRDLSSSDIERFMKRYYSRMELALLLSALDMERKQMAEVSTFRERTNSEATAMYGGLPEKLDMALQHDFPEEFGMVANKKSVRNILTLMESLVPAMLVRNYGAKKTAHVG